MPRRVAVLEAAPDAALALTSDHRRHLGRVPVARLVRGPSALRPAVRMLDSEYLDGAQRERLRFGCRRYVDERVRADLAPLFARGGAGRCDAGGAWQAASADRGAGGDPG